MQYRIGCGYDVHAFCVKDSAKLVLGGVTIPCKDNNNNNKGLLGHSDADVLLHAIMDAVLGALALNDIGHWFPNNDNSILGIASSELFKRMWKEILSRGWSTVNCDSVIVAEKPKLAPYIVQMRENISDLMQCPVDCISVKATTSERLGFCGREEGIAASAVVLLQKD